MEHTLSLTYLLTASVLLLGCSHHLPIAAPTEASAMAIQAVTPAQLAGSWRMHLKVGTHLFEDRLTLTTGLGGQLEVPGKFTAPLEQAHLSGRKLTFEILADEGPTPYRVRYEGRLDTKGTTYTGRATLPQTGETLGTFVAEKQEASNGTL
jgi:hypothetical protein